MVARTSLAALVLLVAEGCGHVSKLRPAERGTVVVDGAVGGPLTIVGGAVIPAPMTTVGASYGVGETFDVSAHVHPTALLFSVVGADFGASFMPHEQRGFAPTVTVATTLYSFAGIRGGFRPYLELSGAASWELTPRWAAYGSLSVLGQRSLAPIWAAGVGAQLRSGRGALQLEVRWFNPSADSSEAAVEWVSPLSRGAFGVVLGGQLEVLGREATP